MFTTANFPGAASPTQLTAAQNLYALLTGRVTQITGDARIDENTGQYVYLGAGIQRARDARLRVLRPGLVAHAAEPDVNLGLRYELQLPFTR